MREPPLFIPLRAVWFDAFAAGTKAVEYRRLGPRWNAHTCRVDRAVILSRGYGKAHRLTGRIIHFEAIENTAIDLYPLGIWLAGIHIALRGPV